MVMALQHDGVVMTDDDYVAMALGVCRKQQQQQQQLLSSQRVNLSGPKRFAPSFAGTTPLNQPQSIPKPFTFISSRSLTPTFPALLMMAADVAVEGRVARTSHVVAALQHA